MGANTGEADVDDDEFDTYRKRMMLAYRFRPNPLVCKITFSYKIFTFDGQKPSNKH